jgi:hypothetical protein
VLNDLAVVPSKSPAELLQVVALKLAEGGL